MPREGNNQSPPPMMTGSKAFPVIIAAGVLDAIRIFFVMFWFFGPALAAVACTSVINDAFNTGVAATAGKMAAAGCTAVSGVAGFFGVGIIETFGVIMSEAMGLLGFLALVFWILMTNARLFKVNRSGMLWLSGGLGLSVIPFIGAFPFFSVVTWKLYKRQIKVEMAARKRWETERAAVQLQEREQQAAELMQVRATRQQAANDEFYAQQAENDDRYEIPEEGREAA